MPQVPPAVRRMRARLLREEGDRARAAYLARRIGGKTEVLIESEGMGRCPYYAPVRFDRRLPLGNVVPMTIVGADADRLYAEGAG
jgi:threonylcarbamoyladenosine tRNA methylthiotransferase MtaB